MPDRQDAKAWLAAAFRPLLLALVLVSVVAGGAAPAFAKGQPTYLTSGELLGRALGALFDKIGATPKVSMILVEPALITVLTQGKDKPYDTNEWTISRFKYLWFDRDQVGGPAPHHSEGIVPEAEHSFFDISEVNIAGLEDIIGRAAAYAQLQQAAAVTLLRISREIHGQPDRTYGAVQWRIGLSSGSESATVYADGAGNITGGDLSGTVRAQRLDLLSQDDWPADEAQAQLAAAIGDRPIVHEVGISKSGIRVTAEHPESRNLLRDYFWDYSGIKRDPVEMPNPLAAGPGDFVAFALTDIKLSALPSIKAAARRAFASPTAAITGIAATKPAAGTGAPQIRWRVDFQDTGDDTGHVDVSPSGDVLDVVLPDGRQPKTP